MLKWQRGKSDKYLGKIKIYERNPDSYVKWGEYESDGQLKYPLTLWQWSFDNSKLEQGVLIEIKNFKYLK